MNIRSFISIFISIVFLSLIPAKKSYAQWQSKVHDTVFKELGQDSKTEVIIEMTTQADLIISKTFYTKIQKGNFVYHKLKEQAEKDQKEIIAWLESQQISHRPFLIVNAIWAYCSMEEIEYLTSFSKIKQILPNIKLYRAEIIEPDRDINQRNPETVEWGIEQINADDVWDMGYDGAGVVVGGQDTGYEWEHEALIDKYRGWDGSTADHNYNWHDAIHEIDDNNTGDNPCGLDSPEPCDDHYHGTHTMGTMIGSSGSNEIGVAPGAEWIGCRNMERGYGTPDTYLECFEWFLAPTDLNDENPNTSMAPHVINNSWGCPPSEGCNSGNFSIMETAINNLVDAGVVVVASAGNSGSSCSTIDDPPAFYESSFSVGATNSSDVIASFSSRGPTANYGSALLSPNVTAPGVSVRSSKLNNTYGTASGTSMAGPHVAGLVALLISAEPSLAGDVAQIEDIIEQTAVELTSDQECGGVAGSEIPNNTYGYGRINALAAVNTALGNLPLEILSFDGQAYEKYIELNWEVDNVKNVDRFDVEKSTDKQDWMKIGSIPVDKYENTYTFRDYKPGTKANYYRIKVVDFDETEDYSPIIVVRPVISIISDLFPNPISHSKLHILLQSGLHPTVSIRISRLDGKMVWSKSNLAIEYENRIEIPVDELQNGLYIIKITDSQSGEEIQTGKFIKSGL